MEYTLICISILLVFMVISLFIKLDRLEGRMKAMQYKLDRLVKQSDIPENPINDDLRQLIKEGKDVKAVKKARETLGLSLVEGKQYIDKLKMEDT
ncbi:hypothetical protein NSA56_00070 [Oceanobacillus caeni]|uniref:Ribosomal protein L7/L12 C-terminal domain-containing protein n=1 Tax=Oceanobacillus caeni TaxID=405946 RepID=A0ABR5MFW8_9BACI|nr:MULTISPECIES: hypothetical protein [Bacillaceae]KKE80280.1 hypothetical protein WH51_03130 [Bacilli bacterium VT-13-104]PZD87957.1 hypothetical protein DEJ64_04465 [Bacilli bacterium]KPH71290.1 hypothetical protein AFL42_15640 [Oceanobacillus caeni]MBU8789426.1 hypothetical protein [Oceanobacillus caeni]MCR1832789.1 hypothetical protein [Oceanobacillus caeni]